MITSGLVSKKESGVKMRKVNGRRSLNLNLISSQALELYNYRQQEQMIARNPKLSSEIPEVTPQRQLST